MTTMASIEIPKDILRATRMTPTELKVELAITLFQGNKLSFGKAREMAGIAVGEAFQVILVLGLGLPEGAGGFDLGHDPAGPQTRRIDIRDRVAGGLMLGLGGVIDG